MTTILIAFGALVLGAIVGGLLAWRRSNANLATTRAAYGDMLHDERTTVTNLYAEVDRLATQLDACEVLLDRMTTDRDRCRDAHDRGAEEFERLLEIHRAVPEAFRAPLGHLDRGRAPAVLLYDAYAVPRMGDDAAEAARLAAILDAPTDVWKRVVYRTPGAVRTAPVVDTGTVHEGEVLPPAGLGTALAAVRTYPAPKQRNGKGKRR